MVGIAKGKANAGVCVKVVVFVPATTGLAAGLMETAPMVQCVLAELVQDRVTLLWPVSMPPAP